MVFIRQKTPILRVNHEKLQFYLTSKNQFLPISPNFSYKCMLVDGKIQEEDRELLLKLVEEIKNDKLLITHIIGIKKVKNNSFTLLVNYGDYEIEFGELKNYKQKLENLKEFYIQYLCKVPKGTYKTISLKYNNQIVGIKNTIDEHLPKSTEE
jgi:cell division protein FtsQ